GTSVNSDGSNINPVALKLMQFKLPNDTFLVPTPQTVDQSLPLASQGLSTISVPCRFDEDQFLTNADVNLSKNSRLSFRLMWSDGQMNVSFPGNGLNGTGNISGFPSNIDNDFRVLSLSYTEFLTSRWLNEIRFGYTQTLGSSSARAPFQWSDLGVA